MQINDFVKDALSKFLTKLRSEVVNGLTSTATNKPLAANQGKVLSDRMDNAQYYTYGVTVTQGLNVRVYVPASDKNLLAVSVQGTLSSEMATSAGYVDLITLNGIADYVTYSHIKYEMFNATTSGQLLLDSSGRVRIGYTKSITTGNATNIASGQPVRVEAVFVMS